MDLNSFPGILDEKVELYDFSGNYSKKMEMYDYSRVKKITFVSSLYELDVCIKFI